MNGPMKGDRMSAVDQMLILRGCSWKKYMSLMNMRPPPAATTEKKPLRMRAAMKDLKEVAAAHQAAVPKELHWKKRRTGRRPKYADHQTTKRPPTPSMKTLPAVAWLMVLGF